MEGESESVRIEEDVERLHAYKELVGSPAWADLQSRIKEARDINQAMSEVREPGVDNSLRDVYDKGQRAGMVYISQLPANIIKYLQDELGIETDE